MLPLALSAADQQRWILALVVALVVLSVVSFLLHRVLVAARTIHGLVRSIWTGGKRIAANTVNIAQLERTNHLAGVLLKSAEGIASSAERIRKGTEP